MRTSSVQKRCEHAASTRVCVARVKKDKDFVAHVAALGLPLLPVRGALADVPSLDDLQGLSYESAITPKTAAKVVTEASNTASQLDALSGQDLTPLLAGLAVGIVAVGGAIAFFNSKPSGPKIQVP